MREETGWSKNTVITMLSRLEGKEAVRHEEGRRAKLYFPAVGREDAIEAETETFLDKIGGLGLLMSAMVEKNALTENDIAELSAILEKAGGETMKEILLTSSVLILALLLLRLLFRKSHLPPGAVRPVGTGGCCGCWCR